MLKKEPRKPLIPCLIVFSAVNEKTKKGICIGVSREAPPDAYLDDVIHLCTIPSKPTKKACDPTFQMSMTPGEARHFGVQLIRASVYGEHALKEKTK